MVLDIKIVYKTGGEPHVQDLCFRHAVKRAFIADQDIFVETAIQSDQCDDCLRNQNELNKDLNLQAVANWDRNNPAPTSGQIGPKT